MLRSVFAFAVLALSLAEPALAQEAAGPELGTFLTDAGTAEGEQAASAGVRLILGLTALSLLPGILLAMTPFTRFIIVFSLLRQALGLQQSPPNQVLIGLSLALTLLVMQPTVDEVWTEAAQPYVAGEMSVGDAYDRGIAPMRTFMLKNVKRDDLGAALKIAKSPRPETVEDISTPVLMTGFVLSELRTAFVIAIKIYLPFLVVDLIAASVLLGMGMMMLPPVIVSLPFKLMVFVLMDGWGLLVSGMVGGIR